MLKKSTAVLLVLILTLSAFALAPVSVSAETIAVSGDYSYALVGNDDDGYTAEITAYSGSDSELTLPGTLDGYTVTGIRREVFRNKAFLTSVTFPDTVTFIADYAFADNANLVL